MKLKLITTLILALCFFTLGIMFGKYNEIEHRQRLKQPIVTAHSSILKTGQSLSEDIVGLGFDIVMKLTKGE